VPTGLTTGKKNNGSVGGRAGVRVAHTSQWLTEEAQIKNVSTAVEEED